ncbi:MAG: hypothetical protein AAFV86_13770 [Pseudomonadota bacterium]
MNGGRDTTLDRHGEGPNERHDQSHGEKHGERSGGLDPVAERAAPRGAEARALKQRQRRLRHYSRFVRVAKILLPLAAMGVLASIFLSGQPRPGLEDMLSAEEIARLGAGLRLDSPRFAGRTEDGNPFMLSAEAAVPDGPLAEEIALEAPRGQLTLADGRRLTAIAEGGMMRRAAETLTLEGGVTLASEDGYRFETERLTLDFESRSARAPGAVVGTMDGTDGRGRLEAGRFLMEGMPGTGDGSGEDDGTGVRLIFDGGVRVLFTPP